MGDYHWELCLLDDETLQAVSTEIYAALYQQLLRHGAWDEMLMPSHNPNLPVLTRSFRYLEPWRIFLLLTPWMLARLWVPLRDPGLPLPAECGDGLLLGPPLEIELMSQRQKAHLQYQPRLGHHLIQPLVQSLHKYADAEAVFSAWSAIVTTRNTLIREHNRRCEWQQDVSRREMFSGLLHRRTHTPQP
ncbi:MAG: [NiFe]-hydrogenase assembly chaperone HybE [Magnetococcales bacterium]|nr:[NiFe]-hydrogenase assembly chaperone HybE [Magnetococcales bacterium]